MIIVYPTDGWNSFLSEADADVKIASITGDTLWSDLDSAAKEVLLINSALYLTAIAEVNLKCDFPTAQAVVIQSDLVSGGVLTGYKVSLGEYDAVKVGPISVDYASTGKTTASENIPPMVSGLLRDCLYNQGGMTQGFDLAFG